MLTTSAVFNGIYLFILIFLCSFAETCIDQHTQCRYSSVHLNLFLRICCIIYILLVYVDSDTTFMTICAKYKETVRNVNCLTYLWHIYMKLYNEAVSSLPLETIIDINVQTCLCWTNCMPRAAHPTIASLTFFALMKAYLSKYTILKQHVHLCLFSIAIMLFCTLTNQCWHIHLL